jgi:hypothetical protein
VRLDWFRKHIEVPDRATRSLEGGTMSAQKPARDDFLAIARLAGLDRLGPYEAELVDAYDHIRRLVTLLPQPSARGSEPAHIFDPARFGPMAG